MTVNELIKLLQTYPGNIRVVAAGYEGGYNDILNLEPIGLKLNVNDKWYLGPHERPDDDVEPCIWPQTGINGRTAVFSGRSV
jgi:hypothetical protein